MFALAAVFTFIAIIEDEQRALWLELAGVSAFASAALALGVFL